MTANREEDVVYMAGPIQHARDYGRGWREWLKSERDDVGIKWYDPMDAYDSMAEAEAEWTSTDIVEKDLEMIDESDALLVHWGDVKSTGTPMEVFYANRTADVPVVVQTTLHEDDISPWIEEHSTAIVESFGEAIAAIQDHT